MLLWLCTSCCCHNSVGNGGFCSVGEPSDRCTRRCAVVVIRRRLNRVDTTTHGVCSLVSRVLRWFLKWRMWVWVSVSFPARWRQYTSWRHSLLPPHPHHHIHPPFFLARICPGRRPRQRRPVPLSCTPLPHPPTRLSPPFAHAVQRERETCLTAN